MLANLKSLITALYTGSSPGAVRFRYALIVFDLATILYFIVSLPLPATPGTRLLDWFIAAIIFADFLCRFILSRSPIRYIFRIYVLSDLIVVAAIVLNPITVVDLSFLRLLRGLRFGYSEYLLQDLRRDFRVFREQEHIFVALLNLVIFLFVTASAVYTFSPMYVVGVDGYINSIYFTVATLTTTGFGDITPTTNGGKIATVVIMIVGVTLFVNLAKAIFSPAKVHHVCKTCGLSHHDPDAIYCKHCGTMVRIETTGSM